MSKKRHRPSQDQVIEDDTDSALDESDPPSRSAQKREAQADRKLGQRLAELKERTLHELEAADVIDSKLLDALLDWQRFPSHGAQRRQMQLIGKLMRKRDSGTIESHLDAMDARAALTDGIHHQAERWREALIAGNDALTEFLESFPSADRQHLRRTINRTRAALEKGEETSEVARTAARQVYRLIRKSIEAEAKADNDSHVKSV